MILDRATLQEATFQLLASSTARRYIREAGRLAGDAGLLHKMRSDTASRAGAQQRVTELLAQIDGEELRSPAEFEAAILLCGLARANIGGEMAILKTAASSRSQWIRALAARLLQLAPPTLEEFSELEEQLATFLTGDVRVNSPLLASDRESPGDFPRAA